MTPHLRKLLPPDDHPLTPQIPSPISSSKFAEAEAQNLNTNYSTTCCYNSLKLSPPFDSAMALTVLVLLTALFFMGFFSIYIRRFADESSVDPTRRRRASQGASESSSTASYLGRSKGKGVDPTTIESLPVYVYDGGDAKQGIDESECAICLSEFEEREWVKEIPYCGHVFHVECIDTWLSSHVTCPLCRTEKLFRHVPVEEHVAGEQKVDVEDGLGVSEVQDGGVREVRLTVDLSDTWNGGEESREVGPLGVRRSTSSSWFGERVTLHRSLSF